MRHPRLPQLRFSPAAWAKLLYLRDIGDTEVGGFGISRGEDPFYIDDVRLVGQTCTSVAVVFNDDAVADFFDEQVDTGLRPDQFSRLWIHTHPGECPRPSLTDEETFARVFGSTDWALMFILAQGGATYARLRFSAGPSASIEVPWEVDFSRCFSGSDFQSWTAEYRAHVQKPTLLDGRPPATTVPVLEDDWWSDEAESTELGERRLLGLY